MSLASQETQFTSENPNMGFQDFLRDETTLEINAKSWFASRRLTERGKEIFPKLLLQSIEKDNGAAWLIEQLGQQRLLKNREGISNGTIYRFSMIPEDAVETLVYAQLNRLKLRAHCRVAIQAGKTEIAASRRSRSNPLEMEACTVDPKLLLNDLRRSAGSETTLC